MSTQDISPLSAPPQDTTSILIEGLNERVASLDQLNQALRVELNEARLEANAYREKLEANISYQNEVLHRFDEALPIAISTGNFAEILKISDFARADFKEKAALKELARADELLAESLARRARAMSEINPA